MEFRRLPVKESALIEMENNASIMIVLAFPKLAQRNTELQAVMRLEQPYVLAPPYRLSSYFSIAAFLSGKAW